MRRRAFMTLLGGAVLAQPLAARAQQAGKMPTVGLFSAGAFAALPAFVEGLRGFGWSEGKNIAFVSRSGENRLDVLSKLAAELVRLNVDVIVTAGTLAPLAAKQATRRSPLSWPLPAIPSAAGW